MGFPVSYSEQLLPRLLLLLGHLHRLLLCSFRAVGLGDLVDLAANAPAQDDHAHWHGPPATAPLQHRFRAIEDALPALRLDELLARSPSACAGGDCSVCLCAVAGADEVRRLPNCRHVFHRACIDRWMAHGQRTCPLCRAPLMPGDDDAEASLPVPDDSDYEYLSYPLSPLPPMPTPTLLRPHELLLNGLGGFQ